MDRSAGRDDEVTFSKTSDGSERDKNHGILIAYRLSSSPDPAGLARRPACSIKAPPYACDEMLHVPGYSIAHSRLRLQ